MLTDLHRRDWLKLLSAFTISAPLALPAPDPGAPLYFTKDEFQLLDALTELIIPADEHSPGSHAAGVAAYIDKTVAEAFLAEDKESWRKGLSAVDHLSMKLNDKSFLQSSKDRQIAVLKNMAEGEEVGSRHGSRKKNGKEPQGDAQKFFGQLKNTAVFAYYSSSIGIHQEMNYKGNVLLKEFVGYLPDAELPPLSSLRAAT
jgi:hypothetical protein